MSTFCYSQDGEYRKTMQHKLAHMEFVLDAESEVADLPTNTTAVELHGEMVGPCAPGSAAIVPSTGAVYMMDCTGAWYKM